MKSVIVASREFETHWTFVVNLMAQRLSRWGQVEVYRGEESRPALANLCPQAESVTHLFVLGCQVEMDDLQPFVGLQEATFPAMYGPSRLSAEAKAYLEKRGVLLHDQHSEGFWGQSVAECALALTLCALRRIPQNYRAMLSSHDVWEIYRHNPGPDSYGAQFCDSLEFVGGTAAGKRVRVAGMGNIGSRYAKFMQALGAEVKAYDPHTPDQSFHLAGAERVWHLKQLLHEADIFAMMIPPLPPAKGLINRELIYTLPHGSLLVVVTRTFALDMAAVRERVLNNEIMLAADVFDVEPLPLDDPLLGRDNVIHTPHIAGRTLHANQQWVEMLLAKLNLP